jgi:hypothetical protein
MNVPVREMRTFRRTISVKTLRVVGSGQCGTALGFTVGRLDCTLLKKSVKALREIYFLWRASTIQLSGSPRGRHGNKRRPTAVLRCSMLRRRRRSVSRYWRTTSLRSRSARRYSAALACPA